MDVFVKSTDYLFVHFFVNNSFGHNIQLWKIFQQLPIDDWGSTIHPEDLLSQRSSEHTMLALVVDSATKIL